MCKPEKVFIWKENILHVEGKLTPVPIESHCVIGISLDLCHTKSKIKLFTGGVGKTVTRV